MKGKSTSDALDNLLEIIITNTGKTWILFLDFKKAYNSSTLRNSNKLLTRHWENTNLKRKKW